MAARKRKSAPKRKSTATATPRATFDPSANEVQQDAQRLAHHRAATVDGSDSSVTVGTRSRSGDGSNR